MNAVGWVVVALVVIAVVWVALMLLERRRRARREALQERFGPEYDRAVEEEGGRRPAERQLDRVATRRDRLEIRDLTSAERMRYVEQWTAIQAGFVDDPAAATTGADRLVSEVMRDRGYPVDDFETQLDMVTADHPRIAQNYRSAHAVAVRVSSGGCGTDELRQGLLRYRLLFDELVGDGVPGPGRDGVTSGSDGRGDGVVTDAAGSTTYRRDTRPEERPDAPPE